jgi:predicted secreted Zn-dependent protease
VKQFSGWQIGLLALLFVCVCCELTGLGLFATYFFLNDSANIALVEPSSTPTRRISAPSTSTASPAPTYTRVVEANPGAGLPPLASVTRTPTRVTNPYQVVIPTPTAPTMLYPITFTSDFKVMTYDVTGKTVNEISRSLEANAIADPHEPGSRYYALTRWQLGGDWSVSSSTRGCEVNAGNVTLAITMTLPALATTNGVSADTLKRYNTFMEKAILHESAHAEIALQGARDYQRAIGNHTPVSNCDALKTRLNDLFRRSFDSIDRANSDYDVKTKHGLTQGAVFP